METAPDRWRSRQRIWRGKAISHHGLPACRRTREPITESVLRQPSTATVPSGLLSCSLWIIGHDVQVDECKNCMIRFLPCGINVLRAQNISGSLLNNRGQVPFYTRVISKTETTSRLALLYSTNMLCLAERGSTSYPGEKGRGHAWQEGSLLVGKTGFEWKMAWVKITQPKAVSLLYFSF